ncbi:MAG: VCBS repeat-containing protein [Rubrivivax sp.]
MALTDTGQRLVFELADHEVFEDLTPRVVTLVAGEPAEILVIVSSRAGGARLVLLRSNGARLEISAQSEPIGTPMRWLNPVAVADLDGDGRAEVAAVITPHLGGTLKVYRRQGAQLLEVAALGGFSNHQYGTPELALSGPFPVGGSTRLLVPDTTRLQLRIVGLENGRLVEVGRCALDSPVTGAIRVVSATEVSLGLRAGRRVMAPDRCAR